MAEYNGSIELISGLVQKNKADFPLMEAHAVAVYETDAEGSVTEIRLDEKLQKIKDESTVSQEMQDTIVNNAKEAVFASEKYQTLSTTVEGNSSSILGIDNRLKTVESKIDEGDNDKLKVQFEQAESMLYLFEGEELIKPDPSQGIDGNVISSTTVTGGSGGPSLNYRLSLKVLDESTNLTYLGSDKAIIKYRADFIDTSAAEGEDNLVPATLNFKLSITAPNGAVKNYSFKADSNTDLEYDITEFLTLGDNNVKLSVSYTEDIEGTPVTIQSTKRWIVKIVNMYLTSTFDDSVIKTSNTIITVTVFGDLNKTLHWIIDGKDKFKRENITLFNYDLDINIPMQSHGSHTVEIYLTATVNGKEITSPSVNFDIMFAEAGNTTPIIRAVPQTEVRQQYTTIPIEYSVYQSSTVSSNIELKAISENYIPVLDENGEEQIDEETGKVITELVTTEEYKSNLTVDRTKQIWNYNPTLDGKKTLTITCGSTVRTLTFDVEKFPYVISPVMNGLELDFNPEGRTNQDENYNEFNYNGYDWTLSENFDWNSGGWKTDADGSAYFCIKAGTTATFNYPLFGDENTIGNATAQGNGKEFKLVFKTSNVADVNATWLTCMAETEKFKPVGIQMNMHNGYVSSDLNKLTIPYSEEDIIEFDMNIVPFGSKDDKDIPMIMTYEDGTPVQPLVITDSSTSFTQAQPVPITIGSKYCDVHIYRMKAYNTFLTDKQILNNFIADARTGTEKANRYLRNQIYNAANGQLTPEDLANACPDLRVIKMSVPRFTTDKKDYVNDSRFEMIYRNGREEDNWTAIQCIHSGQGTSSNEYGFSGRNLDLIMKKQKSDKGGLEGYDPIITLSNGEVVSKISFTENSVPTNYLNVKVNIASSENANNALLQKRYDRYLPYTTGAEVRDPKAKNTMEFFNCVIFVQERGYNDLTKTDESRQEFSDDGWHFYAIGNVGDSKKTDSSRMSDPDDTKEFCVEIMDWNRELSAFPVDTMVPANAEKYQSKEESGAITYTFLNQEYLDAGYLYEKIGGEYVEFTLANFQPSKYYFELVDGKYIVTSDTEKKQDKTYYEYIGGEYQVSEDETIDMDKIYYVDILEHDDFSEDYTYGWRYLDDDEDVEQVAFAKGKWIEFYRFITRDLTTNGIEDPAKVAAWKAEFDNWFIKDAAFYYYLYTLRYTMVDNRAKNSFWHYGKVATIAADGTLEYAKDEDGDFIYKFDFWDYDNDTALGIDNAGKLEMSYGVEDNDVDAGGATYFRAANSTFFQRIIKYFGNELSSKYYQYESASSNIFSSEHLIKEFDEWQSQFPEELWRLDYERKYKRTYVNGNGEHWDNALPSSTGADPRFLSDMMNGKKKYQRRQFERNQDFYMSSKFGGTLNFGNRITLRGAGAIDSSGLAVPQNATIHITPYLNMYVKLAVETNGSYYFNQRCKAGETYVVPYPTSTLEFIYIFGSSKIQSVGDLSPMYLQTATLGYGSKLKEVILGNSTPGYRNNALTDLDKVITSNNKLLEILNIENVSSFTGSLPISDIPSIKKIYANGSGISSVTFADSGLIEYAELPTTVDTIRMNNLFFFKDLIISDYNNLLELVKVNTPNINEKLIVENAPRLNRVRLTNINWTDEEGGYGSLTSTDLLNKLLACKGVAEDGSNIEQSVLTGKVKVPAIRQTERDAYAEAWPELTVEATDSITQYVVTFNNYDGSFLGKLYVDQGSRCPDPIATGIFNTPTKPSTAEFDYTFSGWDGIDFNSAVTKHITATARYTETRRKYSVVWYNGNIELQRTEVEYGQGAIYNGEIPVNPTNSQGNKYYLFDGWDTLTSYITENTSVRPVWVSANPYEVAEKVVAGTAINDLEPVEIYALVNNPDFISKPYMTDGDYVTLQLGNMPTYSDNPSEERVLAENYEFDGVNYLTFDDIQLFNEDKDFTIALDFTPGYLTTPAVYMSCGEYANERGFFVRQNTDDFASIKWTTQDQISVNPSGHKPSETKTYREICVIRHKKGDNNLYVYRNNRYSLEPTQVVSLLDTGNVTSNLYGQNYPLTIGGAKSGNRYGNIPTAGKIHYAKIWFKDLGDDICKECCSWTYKKLTFDFCGKERYFTSDNEVTNASFICQELLDEMNPIFYTTTPPVDRINDDSSDPSKPLTGGWGITDLRTWMNSKLLLGFPLHWRQIIKESVIKSMRGGKQSDAKDYGQDKVLAIRQSIRESNGYLYLPSLAEVNSTINASNEAPYWRNELTTNLNAAPYAIFGGNDDAGNSSRIKYLDGDLNRPSAWYLRSPYYATSTLSSMNPMLYWTAVSMEGIAKDDNRVYDPTVGNNVQLVASASLGICPCFSI